ncbi:MAG: type II toxin-antitoxin system mRNA interferase toxin, RelE/StbE family [Bryobacteraceae bacterium]
MRFPFTLEARAQLRAIDRNTAVGILQAVARFGETGAGDAAPLHGDWQGLYRLRVGDYRVIYRLIDDGMEIIAVGHRSEVYR